MGKRFELIVFDWDGTLMDSTGAIVESIQAAARDLDIEPPSDERAHHIIGLGLIDALRHALPDLPAERYRDVAERYRHHFLLRDNALRMFDGVTELLDELSLAGHQLAVATGKTRKGLERAFAVSGLAGRFAASRCADECTSKPDPQMLLELMDEFGVARDATLMIGDTTHDLLMARNAGVAGLGVAYGAHPRQTLEAESPVFCAANVEQLAAWLRQQA
jgi:phosphoglycolate phosphatase